MQISNVKLELVIAVIVSQLVLGSAKADETNWRIGKTSGDVWISADGVQKASLTKAAELKTGDTIQTGGNGRVLLQRGAESIVISPNSVIGIPKQTSGGIQTTLVQRAGSILLEVEKQNVKHFEVETPYLAAVVKGTQFRVTVGETKTTVQVLRGQVEVSDFKTGQVAQVLAGQAATTSVQGKPGLSLSGAGKLGNIEQGRPRSTSVERIATRKPELTPLRNISTRQNVGNQQRIPNSAAKQSFGSLGHRLNTVRISNSIGDVRINFQKVTNGLAHGTQSGPGISRSSRDSGLASTDTKGHPISNNPDRADNYTLGGNSGPNAAGSSNNSGFNERAGNSFAGGNSFWNANAYGNVNSNGNGHAHRRSKH